LPALDRATQLKIANEFQAKLVRYRFSQHEAVIAEHAANSYSSSVASQLATGLRACFAEEPKLCDHLLSLISESGHHETIWPTDPRALLVHTAVARCHEAGRKDLHVGEIAADVNAVYVSTSGNLGLTPRLIGSLLKSIGLLTHRLGSNGRGLLLDPQTRRTLHRLAREYEVLEPTKLFPGCNECTQPQ
jgi:hypothetical protein